MFFVVDGQLLGCILVLMKKKSLKSHHFVFDDAYYKKYYKKRNTRVIEPKDRQKLATFVFAYLQHLNIPVSRVLDAGCGLGQWEKLLHKAFPNATYTGLEISEYLCQKLGWINASIANYKCKNKFNLIICQGVLQYLSDKDAAKAIENMGRFCRGALYIEALTNKDWEQNCDTQASDGNVYVRTAAWYRKCLNKYFFNMGGGLYVSRRAGVVMYELEGLGS